MENDIINFLAIFFIHITFLIIFILHQAFNFLLLIIKFLFHKIAEIFFIFQFFLLINQISLLIIVF